MLSATTAGAQLFALLRKLEEDNTPALTAYDDGHGTWTIGYGSIFNWDLNRPVQEGDTIPDAATAERWMEQEAGSYLTQVQQMVTVPITQNQLVALSSFVYNEGIGRLKSSTLLKLLNSGSDINTVANQFDRWVYSKHVFDQGLANRRAAEKQLFLS